MTEAASKKKRGRPPAFAYETLGLLRSHYPDIKTKRGLQNKAYEMRALSVLKDDPQRYGWLCDIEAMRRGDANSYKPTILTELGRIVDEEKLKTAASEICRIKPKTKDAVTMTRRYRTGKAASGSAVDLRNRITHTINDYLATHPDTSLQQVRAALADAYEAIEELEADS